MLLTVLMAISLLARVLQRQQHNASRHNHKRTSQHQSQSKVPEPIIRQVTQRGVERSAAIRLLEWTAERNPGRDWGWIVEKVILDLERDRSRM